MTTSLLINLHREGILAGRTLRYARECVRRLQRDAHGGSLAVVVVLDRPDSITLAIAESFRSHGFTLHVVDFGNLGKARQYGVSAIETDLIFFLDGDDFISYNWFPGAIRYLQNPQHGRHICHTHYFVGFGEDRFVRIGIDSRDPGFSSVELALDWFFCNNLACRRSVFDEVPISGYDHSMGIGAEDWHWSAEVIAKGFAHVVVPDTTYFYRTKPQGLGLGTSGQFLPWTSKALKTDLSGGNHEGTVPTRDAYVQLLSDADAAGQIVESVREGAAEIAALEPSISYLLGEQRALRIFVPIVNRECLALLSEINRQEQSIIVMADPAEFPGGLPNLTKFVERLCGNNRFLLIVDDPESPPRREFNSGTMINFSVVESGWQADHFASRLLGRLMIDSRPEQLYLMPSRRLIRWLERFSLQAMSFARGVVVINIDPGIDPLTPLPYRDTRKVFPSARYVFVSPIAARQAKSRNWATDWDRCISRAFFEAIGSSLPPDFRDLDGASEAQALCVISETGRGESEASSSLDQTVIGLIDELQFFPAAMWNRRQPELRGKSGYVIVADGPVEVSASISSDLGRPINQAAIKLGAVLLFRQFAVRRRDHTLVMHRNEQKDDCSVMARLLSQRVLVVAATIVERADQYVRQNDSSGFWERLLMELRIARCSMHVMSGNALAILDEVDGRLSTVGRLKLLKSD